VLLMPDVTQSAFTGNPAWPPPRTTTSRQGKAHRADQPGSRSRGRVIAVVAGHDCLGVATLMADPAGAFGPRRVEPATPLAAPL